LLWNYSLDLKALQDTLIAKGLPVTAMQAVNAVIMTTSRQLTTAEKNGLAKWLLGLWGAAQIPDTIPSITFLREEQVP